MDAPLSDEALVEEYKRALPEARRALADELFGRYYEKVARWCFRFTGERESAADLAQEVFLKVHRHLDTFQGASRFSTWLYSVARHESLSWVRRRGPATAPADEALADVEAPEVGPEELAIRGSGARRLHDLLASTLDATERAVFTLHYGDEMTLDAITRALGLTNASGAKAHIVSARRKLARAVSRLSARGERL